MVNNYRLQNYNDEDVLSFGDELLKIRKFKQAFNNSLGNDLGAALSNQLIKNGVKIPNEILTPRGVYSPYQKWFNEGIDCEMLNLGSKKWKKGKVKIKLSIEFYVEDETVEKGSTKQLEIPESPLDDLRRMMNEQNQP